MTRSKAVSSAWTAWALRFGIASAAAALGSAWLIEPSTPAAAAVVIGVAIAALFVFCLTMPRHQGSRRRRTP
ncbi:DUF2613 family protein [Streptomyces albogriseolus]|uniref:DUF2613 family protein n=1 Tax=Streptomyces albogriseolus TaxID=1887 RepID=UPI0019988629|nr:DUF2613 family protein [Streptomyces sp.]